MVRSPLVLSPLAGHDRVGGVTRARRWCCDSTLVQQRLEGAAAALTTLSRFSRALGTDPARSVSRATRTGRLGACAGLSRRRRVLFRRILFSDCGSRRTLVWPPRRGRAQRVSGAGSLSKRGIDRSAVWEPSCVSHSLPILARASFRRRATRSAATRPKRVATSANLLGKEYFLAS